MREYVAACAAHENAARTRRVLRSDRRRAARPHARFVNTLARLEYVGVRKILKSRRSERIDLDGLQHILDEAVHALRLKKAAVALAGSGDGVVTFADGATLAGERGRGLPAGAGPARRGDAGRPAGGRRARGELPPDQRRHRGARPGLLSDLRRVPARAAASGSRSRRSRRTRTATWRRWRPGWSGRCPTGAARLEAVLARRGGALRRVSWPRSRRRCRRRVPMAQFRSLSADDVRGILRRVLDRGLSRPPADRRRHHQHQRARRDRGRARCSCASTRASPRTTCGARRPSSRTPPRAACRRRCRAPTRPARCSRAGGTSSCRCFPGCRGGRWHAPS